MSGFLVDTNIPSELVRPLLEPRVETWIAAQNLDTLFISAVSFGELRKGMLLLSPGKRKTELVTEILEEALAERFGREIAAPRRSPEEVRAWLDELASLSDRIPPRPGETFSREMIYQDHA